MRDLSYWHTDSLGGEQAQYLWRAGLVAPQCGILVPWPGIKPTSPALPGRFLTKRPPRKSLHSHFKKFSHLCLKARRFYVEV